MTLADNLRRRPTADAAKPAEPPEFPKLEFHPIANIFPMMDEQSHGFQALVEDIKERNLDEAIWLYEGKILEGRNRYRACELAGRIPRTREYVNRDPVGFVLSANLHRRHLNEAQRALVAAQLANLKVGDNQKSEGTSIEVAATLLNISRASVERAKVILTKGDPNLIAAVQQGDMSLTAGAQEAAQQQQDKDKDEDKDKDKDKDKNKSKNKSKSKTPGDQYDRAEKSLLEKLHALDASSADAYTSKTIKKLKKIVADKFAEAAEEEEEEEEEQDEAA
jgi:hypothetical protein